MTSHKRQRTSRYGNSQRSRKKADKSARRQSSSAIAATFGEVFGKTESIELQQARAQLLRAETAYREVKTLPEPTIALLRARWKARRARLAKAVQDLKELISYLETTA